MTLHNLTNVARRFKVGTLNRLTLVSTKKFSIYIWFRSILNINLAISISPTNCQSKKKIDFICHQAALYPITTEDGDTLKITTPFSSTDNYESSGKQQSFLNPSPEIFHLLTFEEYHQQLESERHRQISFHERGLIPFQCCEPLQR